MLNEFYKTGIIGLGLMGTAIARALREKCGITQDRLFACDKDSGPLNAARQEGLICKGWTADKAGDMLSSCDVVFLCLNPCAVIRFLEQWNGAFKNGCIVTDIAGTKSNIAAAAEKILKERADGAPAAWQQETAFDFIPGHPMTGAHIRQGESGFAASKLCDFNGKNYILTPLPHNKPKNIEFLKNLIHKMGFGSITETSPAEHDKKIAFTSQLCHVIACALIDCEADPAITRFGGGSFEDLTRIAMLNAPMWTELFIENSDALISRIEQFEASMDSLKTLIKSAQAEELQKKLELVRDLRNAMNSVMNDTN